MEAPKHFKFKELYKRRREAIDINLRRQKQVRFIRNARLEKLQLENIRGMDDDSANKEMMRLDGISKGLGYEVPEQTRKQKLVYGRADNNRNMQMMPGFSVIDSLNNLNDNIMGINNMLPFDKRLYQFIIPDIAKLNREGFVSDQVLVIDTDKNEYALYDINDLMNEFPVETQSQLNGYIRRVYINNRLILSYVNNKDSMFMSKLNKLNDIAKPVVSFDDFDNMIVTKAITGTGTGTGRKDETYSDEDIKDDEKQELGTDPSSEPIITESQKTGSGPKIEVKEPSSSEYTAEQFKEDEKEEKKKEDLIFSSKQKEIQSLKDTADKVIGARKPYKGTTSYYINAIIMFKTDITLNNIISKPYKMTNYVFPKTMGFKTFDTRCINPLFRRLKNSTEFFYGSIGYLVAAYEFMVEPMDGMTKKVEIGIKPDLSNIVTAYNRYLSMFTVTFTTMFLTPSKNIIKSFNFIHTASTSVPTSFMDIKLYNKFTEEELNTIIKNTEEQYKDIHHPYTILKMILSYSSSFYKKYGNMDKFKKIYDDINDNLNKYKTIISKIKSIDQEVVELEKQLTDLEKQPTIKLSKKGKKGKRLTQGMIKKLNQDRIIKLNQEIKMRKTSNLENTKIKDQAGLILHIKHQEIESIDKYTFLIISIRVLANKYKNNEKYLASFNKNLFK